MKVIFRLIVICVALSCGATTSFAANGTWTNTTGGAQTWWTTGNWQGGTVAGGNSGDVADLSTVNIGAGTNITLSGSNVVLGTLRLGDTASGFFGYTISSGTLTFNVPSGNAAITSTASSVQNSISAVVSGAAPLSISGRELFLSANNSGYSGDITIESGGAVRGGVNMLGSSNTVILSASSSMRVNTSGTFRPNLQLGSLGNNNGVNNTPGLVGAYIGGNSVIYGGTVTLSADASIGAVNSGTATFNGGIDAAGNKIYLGGLNKAGGSAFLPTGLNTTFSGTTGVMIVNSNVTNTSEIVLGSGIFRLTGGVNRFAPSTLLAMDGGTGSSLAYPKLVLDGVSQEVGGLGSSGTGANIAIVGGAATNGTLVVNVSGAAPAAYTTFAGVIGGTQANENNIGFEKKGGGLFTLTGTNTYGGNTVISSGTLALGSAGRIDGTPVIAIAAGAGFDVSAVSGGFTVGSGQSLTGSGNVIGNVAISGMLAPGSSPGTLSFLNDLTLSSGAATVLEMSGIAAGQFDSLAVTGSLALGGALTLGFGTTYADGSTWDLWSSTGDLTTGDFSAISLAGAGYTLSNTPTLTSKTWSWSTTNGQNWTLNQDTGVLVIVVPEPSTCAMLLGGAGLLICFRRRW